MAVSISGIASNEHDERGFRRCADAPLLLAAELLMQVTTPIKLSGYEHGVMEHTKDLVVPEKWCREISYGHPIHSDQLPTRKWLGHLDHVEAVRIQNCAMHSTNGQTLRSRNSGLLSLLACTCSDAASDA